MKRILLFSKAPSIILGTLLIFLFFFIQPIYAVTIFGDSGLAGLGFFTGDLTYSFIDATTAQLVIALTNTSPVENGGYLTAFVFNNPQDLITGVTFTGSDSHFKLLGGSSYDNKIKASPFGRFDIGASIGKNFGGGKKPKKGIAVGVTETFSFAFTGTGLDTLNEYSFISELSEGKGAGKGYQFFVARFRGFNDGRSDKVPGKVIPEPATLSLLGLGLLGLLVRRKK